ncbi:MAG: sugar ABC transporter ATP-binding protein [Candidatus Epulonipiscioides saccharophilum]|nr:MAG: sugar ABC transporter ATP-binding protein [Epulopiscium sp. AS2M-Bin001]
MIEIKNLQKTFDNKLEVLKDINLSIQKGEFICLLGASGCGKSTLLHIIAGLLPATSGDIQFNGNSIIKKHPKDRDIALVFQNYALYPHMTVLENIMFPLRVGRNKVSLDQAKKEALKYMEITNIELLANKKPAKLSGGQQQRVAITTALVQKPEVLLLDEPLNNLDSRLRIKIRDEIKNWVKTMNITTIFVTHDHDEALSISDRVALMHNGMIIQFGRPQDLYCNPNNIFVAKFIGNPSINLFIMRKQNNMFYASDFQISLYHLAKEKLKTKMPETDYLVGIRPEYFMLTTKENSIFETIIISKEFIGRDCVLTFKVDKQITKMIVNIKIELNEGDRISVGIDYHNIYIFTIGGGRIY